MNFVWILKNYKSTTTSPSKKFQDQIEPILETCFKRIKNKFLVDEKEDILILEDLYGKALEDKNEDINQEVMFRVNSKNEECEIEGRATRIGNIGNDEKFCDTKAMVIIKYRGEAIYNGWIHLCRVSNWSILDTEQDPYQGLREILGYYQELGGWQEILNLIMNLFTGKPQQEKEGSLYRVKNYKIAPYVWPLVSRSECFEELVSKDTFTEICKNPRSELFTDNELVHYISGFLCLLEHLLQNPPTRSQNLLFSPHWDFTSNLPIDTLHCGPLQTLALPPLSPLLSQYLSLFRKKSMSVSKPQNIFLHLSQQSVLLSYKGSYTSYILVLPNGSEVKSLLDITDPTKLTIKISKYLIIEGRQDPAINSSLSSTESRVDEYKDIEEALLCEIVLPPDGVRMPFMGIVPRYYFYHNSSV